jgi:hypothetical protein
VRPVWGILISPDTTISLTCASTTGSTASYASSKLHCLTTTHLNTILELVMLLPAQCSSPPVVLLLTGCRTLVVLL